MTPLPLPLYFRAAGEPDLPAIIGLVTRAYRGEASRQGWTTEADLIDGARITSEVLQGDLRRERSLVLLAFEAPADAQAECRPGADSGERLLACAHVCEDGGVGYFGMFAVAPERQCGGIGKSVLAECERIAKAKWQLEVMTMSVIDLRADLIAWYERRGYHASGEYRPFPYGDPRFGEPRRPDLRFAVLRKSLTDGNHPGAECYR